MSAHEFEPTSSLQAVVFDLDGLMFNTEDLYQEVGGIMLARRGKLCTPELLNEMMGRPGQVSLEIMIRWHDLNDSVDDLARETDDIFVDLLDQRLAPMPGLIELLEALETARIPKAIATSSGLQFVRRVLRPFGFEPRFEFLLTAEDVVEGKPAPEIYLKAASRLQRQPAEVLVLEDSQNGCRAAVRAGAFAVAVPGGLSLAHDFTGAAFIARSLADERIYQALGLPR